jgi:hypothetical protein
MKSTVWVVVLLVAASGTARGGERLKVSELVERTAAAVIAEVNLGTAQSAPQAKVLRTIRGDDRAFAPDKTWVGGCTGSIELFRHWLNRFPKWPAARLWRAGRAQRTYRVLLFMAPARSTGKLEPYCETEAMQMEQTSLHPSFDEYVKVAEAEIARRDHRADGAAK